MKPKDSLLSRFKKSLPCFMCNGIVKNHDNFCTKCKNSVMSKCSTPIPKLPKKVSEEKVRYFHVKQASPPENFKETACFKSPQYPTNSVEKSYIESYNREPSVDYTGPHYTKRPSSSLDIRSLSRVFSSKSQNKKKKRPRVSQNKFFHINKSPIPELRSQTPELFNSHNTFFPSDSQNFHKNSLTDLIVNSGILYTSGLDYTLQGHSLYNMQEVLRVKGHSKGIVNLSKYGESIVSSGKDGKVKYWQGKNCVFQHKAHMGVVKTMCSNGNLLFTGNESVKIWQNTVKVNEYSVEKVNHLSCMGTNYFVTGGKQLRVWDVRCWNSSSCVSDKGPFRFVLQWDEYCIWTAGEVELNVFGM